jgi:TolB-like protein/tRNA A-37 threonylcarbamoyl transferase component Bud32
MTPDRWRQITEIFHAARERDAARREAFVAEACRDDPTLRREVEAMLAGLDGAGQFGESPLFASASGPGPVPPLNVSWVDPGSQLGPYQILSLLGTGGMGQVYKAFDPRLHREVAIKIAAERFSERFDREARAIATLNHPNICTIHDVGPDYLVTELVEGETLRDWFRRALPLERNLEIARQVLEALRAAHDAGIVHRDLKPENVMVRSDGYVKVLDFGLAARMPASRSLQAASVATTDSTFVALPTDGGDDRRLSLPGQIVGTIPYMSPEQIQGHEVDQRSDLFAFGIMLYEMLTGRHPWPRPSSVDTAHAILHDDPPAIQAASLMHAELAAIVQKLLRKSPAERYQLADSVLEALGSRPVSGGYSATSVTGPTPLTSIAVLPFVFLSGVEEAKGLSLGFADALITMLGRVEDISVLPTSAILNYAAGTDPARACRDLGTRHLLQGNVQKLGAHWRVSMHLFDAMTEKSISSEQHDFDLDSVFEVQDEIGRQVVESLRKRFPPAVPKSHDRYSSDPEAYNEFMAGLRESYSDRPEVIGSAIQHLSKAVERDPEWALAHAWLSVTSMNMHYEFDPRTTLLEKAEHHCRRALMLDPALPEAHLAQAWILWSPAKGFQHEEAIAALEQVLAVQPNLERAHNRMSAICGHIGRLHESLVAHERARRSNPKTRTVNLELYYLWSGDFTRAEEAGEALLRERPGSDLALCFHPLPPLMRGDLDLAEQRLEVGLKLFPDAPYYISLQGMLHARRNHSDAAVECVRRALEVPRSFGHAHHVYYHIACVYAVLGETDTAMAWFERSVDTGFACWPFFRIDPHLEHLREKPEFIRLTADLEHKYTSLKIRSGTPTLTYGPGTGRLVG